MESIIFASPVPKDKDLVNSIHFQKILHVKNSKLNALLVDNSHELAESVLVDLESVELMINDNDNITLLRYIIGINYIEIGLKTNNDAFLIKGTNKLKLVKEDDIPSNKFKANYYRLNATAILTHFQNELRQSTNFKYSFDNIDPLLESKYFLFRLYSLIIEKKIEPTAIIEGRIISELVTVLIFLSRWNEPFFLFDRIPSLSIANPSFIHYFKAHVLSEIAENTCCGIYPALIYEIKKSAQLARAVADEVPDWKVIIDRIDKKADKLSIESNLDPIKLDENFHDAQNEFDEHTIFRKWILKNHFSLNEHAVYCFCSLSANDNLSIKSNYEHTWIDWVKPFELLVDKIKAEYNLARYFLFLSEDESRLQYNRQKEIGIGFATALCNDSKCDYLLQAFKSAYSILDKLARGIYNALNISQKDIYFHNCWRTIKKQTVVNHNRYLYTLYSIARDLSDTSEFAAFKQYKSWRNLIEHEYFFLIKDISKLKAFKDELPIIKEVISVSEFEEKTYSMLQLCRSAIFSFVFFIRHESRFKTK